MADSASTPITIPSTPVDTPLSPDPEGYHPINPSSSPSFDYHQERRLHLKDEIYFSHHLPRLPPSSLPQSPGQSSGLAAGGPSEGGPPLANASVNPPVSPSSISAAGPGSGLRGPANARQAPVLPLSTGVSPMAFTTRSLNDSIASLRDLNLGASYYQGTPAGGPSRIDAPAPVQAQVNAPSQHDLYYQAESGAEHDPEGSRSTMFSPSGPEDGDLDPTRSFIHRRELDSQERLDLEEEARERSLAGPEAFVHAALAGGAAQPAQPSSGAGPANIQPRPEEQDNMCRSPLDPALFMPRLRSTPASPRGSEPTSPMETPPKSPDLGLPEVAGFSPPFTPIHPYQGQNGMGEAFPFMVDTSSSGSRGPETPVHEDKLLMELQKLAFAENGIGSELDALYSAFARCLDLRDKYLGLSCQLLGDNPRDHDGVFHGFKPGCADAMGLKAEADQTSSELPAKEDSAVLGESGKWNIYPPPPPPHWHWKAKGDGGLSLEAGQNAEKDAAAGESSQKAAENASKQGSAKYDKLGKADGEVFRIEDCEIPGRDKRVFEINDEGVFLVYDEEQPNPTSTEASGSQIPRADSIPAPKGTDDAMSENGKKPISRVPRLREYFSDLDYLLGVCSDGPAKSFAFRRLKYLASKWSLYCLLNEYQELADMKAVPHRDFYNVRKVDTHIHHSASMNQKHLLRFIKSKLKKAPNEIVIHRDGKDLTLAEVFESLNLTAYDLSIDTLDMHAHQEFHRFDRFNDRYNPTGSSRLREIFLKTDNLLKGKYLAELTQELIADLEQSKYQHSEWRLSIYGRNVNEWDKLAKWVINNKLLSHNVRWLIQVPRLYEVFKGGGLINNFEDVVRNVFQPLFEVTQDPSSHPELHIFLQRVVGFDSVDDESKPERRLYRKFPTAKMWNTNQSPPYSYWIYYMYANMASLNAWRRARGFSTFVLRPHCGEAGDPDHLSSAFLTAHSISHGILLRKVPALQYLFYLKQIGLAMSPLSNNALFLTYERNPFKDFFRTGLNVSLSTDDPLQFHFTASHLLEEYSCAAQIYKLTPADMCELARNSVLQSGWEMQVKKHWIGHHWYLPGAAGNDIHKTNVPTIRLAYRHSTLLEELALIRHGMHSPSATPTHLKPPVPSTRSEGQPGLTVHASDVGAAAMDSTRALSAQNSLGAAAAVGQAAGLSAAGTAAVAASGVLGSTQQAVHPGVGALEERVNRKRSQTMTKGVQAE